RHRSGDRPAQASRHGRPDRRAHARTGDVSLLLAAWHLERASGRSSLVRARRSDGGRSPPRVVPRVARSSPRAIGAPRRPRLGFWFFIALLVLAAGGQAVPLYTDWLWFKEVGFTQVFTI